MEQMVSWVVTVPQDVVHSPQTAGGVDGTDLGGSRPNDYPYSFYHLLGVPAVQP